MSSCMNIDNEYKAQTERKSGNSHLGLSGVGTIPALLIERSSGKLCSPFSRTRILWDYSISSSVLFPASRKAGK